MSDAWTPNRRARSRALSKWHYDWMMRHVDDDIPFHPENYPEGSDYNLHYMDLEASPEAEDEFHHMARQLMGEDPPGAEARQRLTEAGLFDRSVQQQFELEPSPEQTSE